MKNSSLKYSKLYFVQSILKHYLLNFSLPFKYKIFKQPFICGIFIFAFFGGSNL